MFPLPLPMQQALAAAHTAAAEGEVPVGAALVRGGDVIALAANAPRLLDGELRLRSAPHIRFAGQITGCEGYIESAAIGLLAGRFAGAEIAGARLSPPPPTTALGALLSHVTGGADADSYQPMNVNFGLFPPIPGRTKKTDRKRMYTDRGRAALAAWLNSPQTTAEPADRQPETTASA